MADLLYSKLMAQYQEKEAKIGLDHLRHLESMFLLHTIDSKWKEHLYAMDRLKEAMGLRALGQRDPLVEYKREGYNAFRAMYESIHIDVAEIIFKLRPVEEERRMKSVFGNQQQMVHQEFSGMIGRMQLPIQETDAFPAGPDGRPVPMQEARVPQSHPPSSQPKIGRNDPCPCGSGKKYKKCCGK